MQTFIVKTETTDRRSQRHYRIELGRTAGGELVISPDSAGDLHHLAEHSWMAASKIVAAIDAGQWLQLAKALKGSVDRDITVTTGKGSFVFYMGTNEGRPADLYPRPARVVGRTDQRVGIVEA